MLISWTTIVGLLRKKIVLGIIFGLSLTYFAISLFAHDKISTTLSTYVDDADESMIIDGDDVPIDDDIDDFSLKLSDADDVNISLNNLQDFGNINSTNTSRSCRNSIQGKVLIVDERGFVCARKEVLPSGCCSLDIVNDQNNDNFNLSKRERYSCDTCTSQGCCAIYEFCVSCCLHPGKKRIKKESHLPQNRRDIQQKYRKIDDTIKQRLRKLDKFQQCLAICRTSSASVRHENTYKNPNLKYCFTNHVIIGNQRSISDSNNNNNGDNVAITSSNVQLFNLDCFIPLFTNKTYDKIYLKNLSFFLLIYIFFQIISKQKKIIISIIFKVELTPLKYKLYSKKKKK